MTANFSTPRYYASEIAGKEKGVIVKNPIFVVGKLSAGQVASVAKYLRAGTAPSELRITGRSIKHADERRPDIVRALVAEFPLHFIENVVVLPNPQDNKKVLLVSTAHRTSSNKSYVAAVEVELRGDALYIASFMTMPDRTLRQAIELGANWQEGQQPPSGDSPHPVESLDAHAEAGFSDVPPIGDTTIPNPDEESTHKSLPADGAFTQEQHMEKIDLLKSHIDAYTRSDGTVVQAHEDNRQAATVMAPTAGGGKVFFGHLSSIHGGQKANDIWHHANTRMQKEHGMSPKDSKKFLESHHGTTVIGDISRHVHRGNSAATYEAPPHQQGQERQAVSAYQSHSDLLAKDKKGGGLNQGDSRRLDFHEQNAGDFAQSLRRGDIRENYKSGV